MKELFLKKLNIALESVKKNINIDKPTVFF